MRALNIFIFISITIIGQHATAQCSAHQDYTDIVDFLEKREGNYLEIEITQINSAILEDHQCYSSWCKAKSKALSTNCILEFNCHHKYSNRNFFRGKEDEVRYQLDLQNKSLQIQVYQGNVIRDTLVFDKLIREGKFLYSLIDHEMMVLNLNFIEGVRIK